MTIHAFTCLACAALGAPALSKPDTLTLSDALDLARKNNGAVRAALFEVEAARAGVRAAGSAYFPTVTPSVTRQDGRVDVRTGPVRGGVAVAETNATLSASWLLFDSGDRDLSVGLARTRRDQTEANALEILRRTLFQVHNAFYNALRSRELLRVQIDGVARAKTLVDRAVLSEEVGAGARIDILQAKADLANAQVGELAARNAVATTAADLKAVVGWGADDLPELAKPTELELTMGGEDLEALVEEALANRPSLKAARQRLETARLEARLARLEGGVRWSATATYARDFDRDVSDRSLLVLRASVPLFDGFRSRENLRGAELGAQSAEASLRQAERDVRADVESALKEYALNRPRYDAAQLALGAARENYEAASEAYREGANDLVAVLTAQVSLTTAETNAIQALYDLLASEVRLRLAVGRPLPGEEG